MESERDTQARPSLRPGAGALPAANGKNRLREDNRVITPGDIFCAMPGAHHHGADFAADAAARGAAAIVTDHAGADIARAAGVRIPIITTDDLIGDRARLAAAYAGNPAEQLTTFAVTGTNGKTTVTFLLHELLRRLGVRAGMIGTVATRIGTEDIPSNLTTPFPSVLHDTIATMVARQCRALVMEASSHAIAQQRIAPITFDVAGFTHLSRDHLDYHRTMDEYYQAKRALFTPANSRHAVITVDDEWGRRLAQDIRDAGHPLTTLGHADRTGESGAGADWVISNIRQWGSGHRFTLAGPSGSLEVGTDLPARFNVSNVALAIVMAAQADLPGLGRGALDAIAEQVAPPRGLTITVPGRMEQVSGHPRVIVDYAHNPGGLTSALSELRETTAGKLIVVFGATGDRDRGKRPEMGRICSTLADRMYLTNEDCHSEDPIQIRAEVRAGIDPAFAGLTEIPDRAQAITAAVSEAGDDDTILIAGRGPERELRNDWGNIPLHDGECARAALAQRTPPVHPPNTRPTPPTTHTPKEVTK